MSIVASAEVQKNFGRYKEAASTEPVVVTQYGKPTVVILTASEYARLKELDRRVLRLDDMSDGEIEEMLQAEIPPDHRTKPHPSLTDYLLSGPMWPDDLVDVINDRTRDIGRDPGL